MHWVREATAAELQQDELHVSDRVNANVKHQAEGVGSSLNEPSVPGMSEGSELAAKEHSPEMMEVGSEQGVKAHTRA